MARSVAFSLIALTLMGSSALAQDGILSRAGQALDNAGKNIRNAVDNEVARGQIEAQDREVLGRVVRRIEWDKQLVGSTIQYVVQPGGTVVLRGSVLSPAVKLRGRPGLQHHRRRDRGRRTGGGQGRQSDQIQGIGRRDPVDPGRYDRDEGHRKTLTNNFDEHQSEPPDSQLWEFGGSSLLSPLCIMGRLPAVDPRERWSIATVQISSPVSAVGSKRFQSGENAWYSW